MAEIECAPAVVLWPGPCRDFVPAADLLFAPPKSRQKALPCKTGPSGCPAMLEAQGPRRTHFATLRSDNCAKSAVEVRFAHALGFCASRRFRRGGPETAQQPTAKPESRSPRGISLAPFSPAEERKVLRPCAQRTSRTDSARLSEQSVAARVPGGATRLEYRWEPEAQRRAGRSGGALCLLSGGPESRSPAGANSRHGPWRQATAAETRLTTSYSASSPSADSLQSTWQCPTPARPPVGLGSPGRAASSPPPGWR